MGYRLYIKDFKGNEACGGKLYGYLGLGGEEDLLSYKFLKKVYDLGDYATTGFCCQNHMRYALSGRDFAQFIDLYEKDLINEGSSLYRNDVDKIVKENDYVDTVLLEWV